MKSFIETHLGVMLSAGAVLGLFLPQAASLPAPTITVMLGFVIFLACLRIQTHDFGQVAWGQVILFWLGRFVVLPLILFSIGIVVAPDYATAILLLALLPAGASSPAFTNIFGGNVPTALFITLLSSAASVFLIPVLFETVGHMQVAVPSFKLFMTLLETIIIPAAIGFPLRGKFGLTQFSAQNGRLISVLLMSAIVVIIIAHQRQTILFDPASLITPLIVAIACYAIFMGVALPLFARAPESRIAVFTSSTFNNTVVGFSLALIDFPTQVVLTMVMAQLCWCLLPLATQPMIARMRKRLNTSLFSENPV
jgi:BASS family bile acid:Na+ symporter